MELNKQTLENLESVLHYVIHNEVDSFEEFMYNEFPDNAEDILEQNWNVTILSNPEILKVAKGHVYFQAWLACKSLGVSI